MPTSKPYRLAELAAVSGASVVGDPDCIITSLAPLQTAQAGQLSFLDNTAYRQHLKTTQASAVLVSPEHANDCAMPALVTEHPRQCFAKIAELFVYHPSAFQGIHPTAILGKDCQIAATASVGPYCVLGEHVVIGDNVVLGAACCIGDYSRLAADCYLWPRVTLYHQVELGKRVVIHSGAVLGSDGFGMVKEKGVWRKIPQLGGVTIGDDVEIGSNTTIDRGTLENTVIEAGVKLDNQIQIAHNVRVGAHTAMAACVGVAGSTRIGQHCMIGGATGISDHLEIADGVMMTGMTMVTQSISQPGIYSSGTGFQDNRTWRKNVARFKQLDQIVRRLRELEKSGSLSSSRTSREKT